MAYVKMVNDKFPNPRQTFEDKCSTEGTPNLFTVRSNNAVGMEFIKELVPRATLL